MKKYIILAILVELVLSTCYSGCEICKNNNTDPSPYGCITCYPNNGTAYITSCTQSSNSFYFYLWIAIVVIVFHLFMLSMGMGMYHEIYQNIQLATLVTWKYGFQGGSVALQATNFAIVTDNYFPNTFGYQFIVLILVLIAFVCLLMITDRMIHSPISILLKRKKIIFPIRLASLFYNVLLLSSLINLVTFNSNVSFQPFGFVLAIFGVSVAGMLLIGVGIVSNWKNFQVDDPNYYVLLQQMSSKKWYAKNSIFISLIVRTIIIVMYCCLFSQPKIVGIIIVILHSVYSLYYIVLIRFVKLRYYILTIISNILMICTLLTSYIGSINEISSKTWLNASTAYIVLLVGLAFLYVFSVVLQIVLKRQVVQKQIKSVYNRFIRCKGFQSQVIVTKYDENSHRERVLFFQANSLYNKDLGETKGIQMTAYVEQ